MKKNNIKCYVDYWIYKNIFILIIRLLLQIYVPIERKSVVMRVCVFVAQCHFFSLSLLPSPPIDYVLCSRHASIRKRKRAKNKIFVCV
jgi:hypothetical protein